MENLRSRCRPIPITGLPIFISQTEYNFENRPSLYVLESYYLRLGIFGDFSEFIENPAKPVSPVSATASGIFNLQTRLSFDKPFSYYISGYFSLFSVIFGHRSGLVEFWVQLNNIILIFYILFFSFSSSSFQRIPPPPPYCTPTDSLLL